MIDTKRDIMEVLRAAKSLLELPGNDFTTSPWKTSGEAVREIDELIASLKAGRIDREKLSDLFANAGPLQEVSLTSDWGDAFIGLSRRLDAALTSLDVN